MGKAEFLWKIVSETDARVRPHWPEMTAFSDDGLRYINLGQRSFLATDLEAREVVGFLPDVLAEDGPGFSSVFLARLFYMTAGALRLTAISAACVAMRGTGLLIFGPPKSGKTTSSHLAVKLGLEFHADQATFLDLEAGGLLAWGDFWPASFRAETAQFLPELLSLTQPFNYREHSFRVLEKSRTDDRGGHSVIPAFCVFLERHASELPRLIPLSPRELAGRLKENLPFDDDERFEPQRAATCRALAKLPAYRLAYGSDPAVAAIFFRSLLSARNLLED